MITILNIAAAFALSVCAHVGPTVTQNYALADAGNEHAATRINLAVRACEASMGQEYGKIIGWECILHLEPDRETHCIIEVMKDE